MDKTPKVLFLSRGGASRAQIAEGFFRALAGNQAIPFSAGTDGKAVNPMAVEVMREAGIDISTQEAHDTASLFHENFQYAVTLCDGSRERFPLFPFTANLLKWPVKNPDAVSGEPEARKQEFREVRDQIGGLVKDFVETMKQPVNAFEKAHAKAA